MKNTIFFAFMALAVVIVGTLIDFPGYAQGVESQDQPQDVAKPPAVPDVAKYKIMYHVAQKEVLVRRYNEAKEQFDRFTADLNKQFADNDAELAKSINELYESTGVDKDQFVFSPVTGEFVAKKPQKK